MLKINYYIFNCVDKQLSTCVHNVNYFINFVNHWNQNCVYYLKLALCRNSLHKG